MPVAEPTRDHPASTWLRYIGATRPGFLAASLVPALLGLSTAHYDGVPLNIVTAVLTMVGAVIAHAGVNVLNDYYDALNGTDAINTERLYPFTGGSRFIQNGVFTPAQIARYGTVLLAVAAVIGLALVAAAGPALLLIGAFGLFIGWAYSAPPLHLNSRGLGELCVAIGFGILIPLGSDVVQRGALSALPAWAGVPYALLVANILYANQFPDCRADAASGKRHWVVRLRPEHARWGYAALAAAAYGMLVAMVVGGALPRLSLLAAAPAALSALAARDVWAYAATPARLRPAIKLTLAAAFLHGLLLAAAFVIAAA